VHTINVTNVTRFILSEKKKEGGKNTLSHKLTGNAREAMQDTEKIKNKK
jgi:hypothetical protein